MVVLKKNLTKKVKRESPELKIKWRGVAMPDFDENYRLPVEKKTKVIIIDDDVDALYPVNQAIKNLNYNVSYCMSGTEAIDVVPILKPDLIILDWNLGDSSADKILEKLDRVLWLENSKAVKLITYSSLKKEETDVSSFLKFDRIDHWDKPLTMNQIKYKVRNLSI